MSTWNSSIQLNRITDQMRKIGQYVGYYYTLTGENGIEIISNDYVASPNGNNTQYAYSSNTRSGNWTITADIGAVNTTNMYIGVSSNLSQTYSSPSAPSMAMVDWGLLLDNQTGDDEPITNTYLIKNGEISNKSTFQIPQATAKMTYDGDNMKMYYNNVLVYTETVGTLDDVYLVVGSFFGGSLSNITWSSPPSSGGNGNQALNEVLDVGDDAKQNDIKNVNNLGCETLNTENITVGGGSLSLENSSGIQFLTSNNIYNVQMSNPTALNITFQNQEALVTDILTIDQNTMTYTFGDQSTSRPSIPSIYVQGYDQIEGLLSGLILDSAINPPNVFFTGSNNNFTTKIIQNNTPTSILQFNLGDYKYNNLITGVITELSFELLVVSGGVQTVTAIFWLSTTKDEEYDIDLPINTIYTAQGIAQTKPFSISDNVILSHLSNAKSETLYLNCQINGAASSTFQLTEGNFLSFFQMQPAANIGDVPANIVQ